MKTSRPIKRPARLTGSVASGSATALGATAARGSCPDSGRVVRLDSAAQRPADSGLETTDSRSNASIGTEAGVRSADVNLLRRFVHILLGVMFMIVGVAGAILPGLPATPFLLLASWHLSRSWPSMNHRLYRSRLVGPILRDWRERRGVRRAIKIRAIAAVVASIAVTIAISQMSPAVLGGVATAASVGIVVIWRLPEVSTESSDD